MMLRENASEHEQDTSTVATRLEEIAATAKAPNNASKRSPAFGGREDLALVYRTAKNLIYTHRLWMLKQFEEEAGVKRLTICNLWRIERHPDASLRTLEYSLATGEWVDAASLKEWPQIPIWPFAETRKCGYWTEIIKAAIWKALEAAGYHDLPKFLNPISERAWNRHIKQLEKKGYAFRKDSRTWSVKTPNGWHDNLDYATVRRLGIGAPKGHKKEMTPSRMAYSLINLFVGRTIRRRGEKDRRKDGRLPVKSQEKGARALRAAFFEHIKEREIMSAMLAIDRERLPFLHYIDWAKNRREPLLRVATEQRNLLPLLAQIQLKHWHRTDLFSRSLWVRGSRKTTVVDRSGFTVADAQRGRQFSSFDNKAAWRWLSNAPFRAVERWAERKDAALATNLALACSNVSKRIPVVAIVRLIESWPDFRREYDLRDALPRYGVSPVIQQLYRLYLTHAAQMWETKGFKSVLDWAGRHRGAEGFSIVMDYLEAEGFQQGQPDKNATWASLMRRSDDWHRRIAIANIEAQGGTNKAWISSIGRTCFDDIEFLPLASSRDLAVEGYELGHCIGQYTSRCVKGAYRVFSVIEPDGTRSTLGLQIRRKKVSIEQHRGRFNGAISPAAEAAGREMAKTYQSTLSLRTKSISPSTNEAQIA